MTDFQVEALSQHWMLPEPSESDLCSHGTLRLVIGDQVVTSGEDDYGLSPSGLAMLRTLERNHTPEAAVAPQLIAHGCGLILMLGCPIGIDWSVVHTDDLVTLSDVRRHDTTSRVPTHRFSGSVTLSLAAYREQVVAFARRVQQFVEQSPPRVFGDPFDRKQYEDFWSEYLDILQRSDAA